MIEPSIDPTKDVPVNATASAPSAPLFPARAIGAGEAPARRVVFWLVKTTPAWLAKPDAGEDGRTEFMRQVFMPILARHPRTTLRYFDTEAYSAWCSDVMMWRVDDMDDYDGLVEALRETAFWDTYFQVLHILPGVEDGYARNYDADPFVAAKLANAVL